MEEIKGVLDVGFMEDYNLCFGDTLQVVETNENGKYIFNGNDSTGEIGSHENGNGVIAIQLDDARREDLVAKGKRIAKRWSAWITIAPVDRLIISVIWRPVRSGLNATRMICSM